MHCRSVRTFERSGKMLTVNEIKIFLEVVKAGSITGASKNLFISQPAVSQHIKTIEEKLNIRLFERANTKLYLTNEGFKVYKELEKLYRIFEETVERVSLGDIPSGKLISIGASKTIGNYFLPFLIAKYKELERGSYFSLKIQNTSEIVERVLNEDFLIGFVEAPVYHKSLNIEVICEDRLKVVCSPNSKIAKKSELTIEELKILPFISREKGSGTRRIIENTLSKYGCNSLNVVVTASSNEAIKELVAAGLGISILSSFVVSADEKYGRIVSKDIDGVDIKRNFFMICKKEKSISRFENKFKEFVKSVGCKK